jgi:hypothetical protein
MPYETKNNSPNAINSASFLSDGGARRPRTPAAAIFFRESLDEKQELLDRTSSRLPSIDRAQTP